MKSRGIIYILSSVIISVATVATSPVDQSDKSQAQWQQVADQCANFDQSVQTLASHLNFQANYDKLNECLHDNVEPPEACIEAELKCRQNGLFHSGAKLVGNLAQRAGSGEPICNIEFASKVYRLHRQLAGPDGASRRLARHLRTLANRWAARCRNSLLIRLQDVDRRAPDAMKHVSLIVNILNLGSLADFKLEPENYVPMLEDDHPLDEKVSSAAKSGYKFDTSKQIDTALRMLKPSCKALKLYHINLIGSIGLTASVGYASPGSLDKDIPEPKERGLVRAWIASAMLCQLLNGVKRMTSVNKEMDAKDEIVILPLQEADLSLRAEQDKTFATFGLPEVAEGEEGSGLDLGDFKSDDLHVYRDSSRLNARKMELINGPSHRLASAIYTYLDLRKQNRIQMANIVLGLNL